jgi:hypothetical protein
MFKVQRSKSAPAALNLEPGTLNHAKHFVLFVSFVVKAIFSSLIVASNHATRGREIASFHGR